MMVTMSVDPGVSGTGWALWANDGTMSDFTRIVPPIECGVLNPKGYSFVHRAYNMSEQLSKLLDRHGVADVYCEFPEFFSGSERGHAATTDGSVFKLSAFIGCIMQLCFDRGILFHEVMVKDWKGQLPKEVIIKRIDAALPPHWWGLPEKIPHSHAWDAIGIGLYAKGFRFSSSS